MEKLVWRLRDRALECGERTLVMGVLNVTPDSFSDGGLYREAESAVRRGVRMAQEGADILDVGGESTRPGAAAVPVEEELARVLPVVEELARETDLPVSIDTRKPEVARAALEAGAVMVNDVSAARDPRMLDVARELGAGLVLMHMLGEPQSMQEDPRYDDVVADVRRSLEERVEAAASAGLDPEQLAVDPGIGFGKTLQHNLLLLRGIGKFLDLGRPLVVGASRKSFIGSILGTEVDDRLEGTAGAVAWLAAQGVHVVRLHDVKEMVRVVRIVDAVKGAGR